MHLCIGPVLVAAVAAFEENCLALVSRAHLHGRIVRLAMMALRAFLVNYWSALCHPLMNNIVRLEVDLRRHHVPLVRPLILLLTECAIIISSESF